MSGSGRQNIGAFTSGGPFQGFESADFDAYEQKKWKSNAYTLARRTAKDKLLALAQAVRTELEEDLADLDLHGSDEAPTMANGREVRAQWAFFLRGADERAALRPILNTTDLAGGSNVFDIALSHQHAAFALRLDMSGLSVGVEMAGRAKADRQNAAAKLADETVRESFVELLAALPGSALVTLGDEAIATLDVSTEQLAAWERAIRSTDQQFRMEVPILRTEDIIVSNALIGTVTELVTLLVPLYRFLAWSPENDAAKLRLTLNRKKKPAEVAPPVVKEAALMRAGDRVTILAGLFSGRAGYLAELDPRGKAKVMVGPVAVTVDAKDIRAV